MTRQLKSCKQCYQTSFYNFNQLRFNLICPFFQNVNSSLPNTSKSDSSNVADVMVTQFRKLMTTNFVVRLNNFTMWKVSTSAAKTSPKEFLSGKYSSKNFKQC